MAPKTSRALYSVKEFCSAHGIARSNFYHLLNQGRGPRITKVGRRTFVSLEAAEDWLRRMESETVQPGTTTTVPPGSEQ